MHLPICSFDAKSGILCPKCDSKLKSGKLTKTDIEISKKLSTLGDKIPELEKATLIHGLDVEGDIVLVVGKGGHDILRKNQQVFRLLENELKNKIWIVESGSSSRKILEELFFPIKILMVNVVWLPDGTKLTKVVVPGRRTKRFPLDLNQVKNVIKEVSKMEVIVDFEIK